MSPTTYSPARWRVVRAVALDQPRVGLGDDAHMVDTLVRDRVVEYRHGQPVLTVLGEQLHARWSREHALTQVPGIVVRRARTERRCACHTVIRPGDAYQVWQFGEAVCVTCALAGLAHETEGAS